MQEIKLDGFRKSGIYAIRNKITGRSYFGYASKDVGKRIRQHIKELNTKQHHCPALQKDWREEDFIFLVERIPEFLDHYMRERLQQHIQKAAAQGLAYNDTTPKSVKPRKKRAKKIPTHELLSGEQRQTLTDILSLQDTDPIMLAKKTADLVAAFLAPL